MGLKDPNLHDRQLPRYNVNVYSAELLDHFQNPRNAGQISNPDATVRLENPACGDVLELAVKFEGCQIAAIRFRAKGCVAAMACGSVVAELASGCSIEDARRIKREDVEQKAGGLPQASSHAAVLAVDALAALLRDF